MKSGILAATAMLVVALLSGCERDYMSERGFSLPEGDPIAGKETFLYMQCNECHIVKGMELPRVALADPPFVELGGDVTRVKTYGDLVTSIINPSHKLAAGYPLDEVSIDGVSKMYVYNDFMTVQELIDIVMFLQPQYRVIIPRTAYRRYR
jgi:mono/diheme cytochrome c family protein